MTALIRLARTTAFKLALGLLAVFVVAAGVALAYGVWQASRLVQTQIEQAVDAETALLVEQYRLGGLRQLTSIMADRADQSAALLYLLTAPTGAGLTGNIGALPPGVIDREGPLEAAYSRIDSETLARDEALFRVTVLPGGFRLVVGRDLGERRRVAEVITNSILGALGLVVLVGLGGGFLVARRVLNRLDSMTATSRAIMAGDLSERLAITGAGDEFDRLAHATNAMLDRIVVLMDELKQVSDNIAHDLRTPLTRLRNRAEEAQRTARTMEDWREAVGDVITESENLIRTFEALLLIARAEAGAVRDQMQDVSLQEIATGIAELYEPVAEEAGFEIRVEAAGDVRVRGHRELLSQALANLVDNAIKYAGQGGSSETGTPIEIRLGTDRKSAILDVADRGPGIPEADRTRVVERFVRLEDSRSQPGSGLGLSLVAAVARLHDGRLTLLANEPGIVARLEIPLRIADHAPPPDRPDPAQ